MGADTPMSDTSLATWSIQLSRFTAAIFGKGRYSV